MSKKNKNKQLGQRVEVPSARVPVSIVPVSGLGYSKRLPSWRFARLKAFTGTRFGYEKALELINDILEKLVVFEKKDWNEIANMDKDHNHWCDVSGMIKEARDMVSRNMLDFDRMFSLRLEGKFRLWGIINNDGSFDIYWIDQYHEIYPSPLKYT